MISLSPVTLEGHGVRLEPLAAAHERELTAAATDGRLWELWFTSVPEPTGMARYIDDALVGQAAGHMLPWAVRDLATGDVVCAGVSKIDQGEKLHVYRLINNRPVKRLVVDFNKVKKSEND